MSEEQASGEMSQQKRQHVRMDDLLPLSFRTVSNNEFAQVVEHFNRHRAFPVKESDAQKVANALDITEQLTILERTDKNLAQVLSKLDMKLNLLMGLFHTDQTQQQLIPTPVNVSGGGIAFWRKGLRFKQGDVLELRIGLSRDGLATVLCFARVVAFMQSDRGDLDRVACKFDPILDKDRERIIQHVFKRQAELLRKQRG